MTNPHTYAMTEPELWGYHEEGHAKEWQDSRDWCLAYMVAHEDEPLVEVRQRLRMQGFRYSEIQAAFVLYGNL